MSHLITSMEFEQHGRELRTIDRPRLLSLYGRYRAVPDSLTEDQRALIYASLCLARHTQISQSDRQDESTERNTTSREDVTYYRMAFDLLKAWGRPSVYSVCEYAREHKTMGLTYRGVVLPCALLDRSRGPSRKYRPTFPNGMAGPAVGITPYRFCAMVRPRRYGTSHILCLPLHGHVSCSP
jgi:hypothetical protein